MPDSTPAKPKAYSYLRFSTPEQMAGDSYRRQTELSRRYAEGHGLELDQELSYQDLGVSAYRGANAAKGQLETFLSAVREGLVPSGSFLLVESLDRLSREVPRRAFLQLNAIVEAGITVVTVADGKEFSTDTLDADQFSLMLAVMLMSRAHEESATKGRRLRQAWEAKRSRIGEERLTSRCPGWVEPNDDNGKSFRLIPERARVVRRIFKDAAAGVTPRVIAKALNAEQVPVFGRGAYWHRSYIVKILANRSVLGEFTPHHMDFGSDGRKRRRPETTSKNYFPPVVTEKQFKAAQVARSVAAPTRGRHVNAPLANVLSGLARCELCGGTMTRVNKAGKSKGGEWVYFACVAAKNGVKDDKGRPRCKYIGVSYQRVVDALTSNASILVSDAPRGSKTARGLEAKLKAVSTEAGIVADMLENLAHVAERGKGPTPATVARRMQELETRLGKLRDESKELTERIASVAPDITDKRLNDLQAALGESPLDVAKVNRFFRSLLGGVTIDPRKGILSFHWRHSDEVTELIYDGAALFAD